MKKLLVLFVFVVLCSGCAASKGEGVTIGPINTGASQAARDKITEERTRSEVTKVAAETAMKEARTQAGIEQSAEMGKIWRVVVLALGVAAAAAALWIGGGYALERATPMAAQGVAALATSLEIRKVKRLEVSLEIGPGGYVGHLLAEGYTREEIADLIRDNPALDGPRVQQLQIQAGPRGMKILAERGELETTLARLPIDAATDPSDD